DRDGRRWQIGVYNPQTGEMVNPQVFWTRDDGSRLWLFADRAIRKNGVWNFYKARQFYETGTSNTLLVPLLQTNVLAMPEFSETPEQTRSDANLASGSLRARQADTPISQILNYLRLHPKPKRSDRAWLYTKLHGRLAAPLTCLVVVLIALPFGA